MAVVCQLTAAQKYCYARDKIKGMHVINKENEIIARFLEFHASAW